MPTLISNIIINAKYLGIQYFRTSTTGYTNFDFLGGPA